MNPPSPSEKISDQDQDEAIPITAFVNGNARIAARIRVLRGRYAAYRIYREWPRAPPIRAGNRCTQIGPRPRGCQTLATVRAKYRTRRLAAPHLEQYTVSPRLYFSLARGRKNRSQILLSSRHWVNTTSRRPSRPLLPSHPFSFAANGQWLLPKASRIAFLPQRRSPLRANSSHRSNCRLPLLFPLLRATS